MKGTRLDPCFSMGSDDWSIGHKPYDLRERLLLFACLVVKVVQFLHTRGPIGVALSEQILKSGTSAGANDEEADDASSPRDKLAKRRIALRELKETLWRLRVARRSALLSEVQDPLIAENLELIKILATVIRMDIKASISCRFHASANRSSNSRESASECGISQRLLRKLMWQRDGGEPQEVIAHMG